MSSSLIPASLHAARFLTRARLYRDQAMLLSDKLAFEPNWPKFFLVTHAIELAINAYLVFDEGLTQPHARERKRVNHDLMALYEAAVRRGLKDNIIVRKELPFLSELHKLHYARYPKIESRPVPAYISEYDDMLDQLFADIGNALGPIIGQMSGS